MAAPGAGQQQPGAQDFKEEPGSRVVVHERVDSKSELDKLFAVVDTQHGPGGGAGPGAGGRPLQVPLKMRNLPASFWQPGPIGTKSPGQSHSRENSLDNSAPFSPGPAPTPPPNHHTRTSSCPPALGQLDRGAGAQHQVTRHCTAAIIILVIHCHWAVTIRMLTLITVGGGRGTAPCYHVSPSVSTLSTLRRFIMSMLSGVAWSCAVQSRHVSDV